MITSKVAGISGKVTNSIASTGIVPEPALHLRGTYSPVDGNSKQIINGKEYNPIHRVKTTSGKEYLVESINPIDLQRNKHAANGTVTNKNGNVYAFRTLGPVEEAEIRKALL